MKELGILFIVVVVALYIGNLRIQLDPFQIRLETWHRSVSALLLWAAIYVYDVYESRLNYKHGFKKGIEHVVGSVNDIMKEGGVDDTGKQGL